jgi:hypothetical protein
MPNKLQQARRAKLLKEEMTADETSIVRQQLRDGIEPVGWNNGFLQIPVEQLPDPLFFIQENSMDTKLQQDVLTVSDAMTERRKYSGIIIPRVRTNDVSRHNQILEQLLVVKKGEFVELVVKFNNSKTAEVLLHTLHAISYINYDRIEHIPFEETLGGLLNCEVHSVSSWTIVGMTD